MTKNNKNTGYFRICFCGILTGGLRGDPPYGKFLGGGVVPPPPNSTMSNVHFCAAVSVVFRMELPVVSGKNGGIIRNE